MIQVMEMFMEILMEKEIIVEFFDYNCSYCKKAHQDLIRIS